MKKFIKIFLILLIILSPIAFAADKTGEEYLKTKKHFSIINPLAESFVRRAIKRAIKKEAPGNYKIKFQGYTLESMKKGIFKYLEITGKNVVSNDIEIPYFNIKTVTDYNWIDYNQSPIKYKSDIEFDYIMHLSEKSINDALETKEYQKILRRVNKVAYPMFTLNSSMVKIKNEKLYIIMAYNFPISPRSKDKTFMVSTKLKVVNNEVKPFNIHVDSAYGNIPIQKVTNLINMLNPLNFTIKLIEEKKCNCKIDEIKIADDIIIVNGKIFIKGDK